MTNGQRKPRHSFQLTAAPLFLSEYATGRKFQHRDKIADNIFYSLYQYNKLN
ncbi:protein of unknown function [Methylocella tundrae]|uniref:Uncharacterized protein n=1 Tax=Methylocella tundrae TaxID=227605 RepID=A0A4U8YTJ8_METTU|nr:protein of unknown function [Methylocella tundrae]